MKRFVFAALAVALIFAGCAPETVKGELSVSPDKLDFPAKGGVRQIEVSSTSAWTVTVGSGSDWCTLSRTSAESSAKVNITVSENTGDAGRAATLTFSSAGCDPVSMSVTQDFDEMAKYAYLDIDTSSLDDGFTLSPDDADADKPAKIYFKAGSSSALYGYSGDVYVHIGVADAYDEWQCVPSGWGENIDKCRMSKETSNVWSILLYPSIREWFASGEAPVNAIAIIARDAKGEKKGVDHDTYLRGITDNKYHAEVFNPDPVVKETMPADVTYGINCKADGSVTFVLYDKDTEGRCHEYCYIVGDWNEWERNAESAMKRDDASGCWWITIDGFDPAKEYRFQYRLGNADGRADTFVSDPYTEIVYDQWNDQYIAGVPAFPEDARGHVSAFRIERPEFAWQHSDFEIEDKHDLVIYEMLFRDFSKTQDIAGAMAQLDYIEGLGVNAIELMPIQEFDGNLSWGYNPNHWYALDKYYGTREDYKKFIDECHRRGMAVIVDVVYNHAYGSHPWAKMYWDSSLNRTASNNPWFNTYARHPFNVGHDMNHENPMVRDHVKGSLQYLLEEYDVDGFRFDLSKGFTQKDSGEQDTPSNVTSWGRYDETRVAILKDYADAIWEVNSNAMVILEHLSDWDEEEVLADYGMQLWRKGNWEYREAVNGKTGNFKDMYSTEPFGGFVGYMESHDEQRLCYSSSSDEEALKTRLSRAAASAAFFFTVPGPKMIWQFGEIGYDYDIEHNGRTGEKPVVTAEYMAVPERKALYDTYAALIGFRRDNPRFFDQDADFSWTPSATVKTITCSADGKTFHVVGNFGKSSTTYSVPSGDWKDYFADGASVSGDITLNAGEFRLLTDF